MKLFGWHEIKKKIYMMQGQGSQQDYLDQFERAERYYYQNYSVGDLLEWNEISTIDFELIGERKRENYKYLLNKLSNNKYVKILFKEIHQNIPFCMPIFMNLVNRNELRKKLFQEGIFLPVHWDLSHEERIQSKTAKEISERIISIPIDYRYSEEDMDHFVFKFDKALQYLGGRDV